MRINFVKSARKPQGNCESCGKPIEVKTPYKWVQARFGPKRSRHEDCPGWRPSELTGSKLATAYEGQEDAEDALDELKLESYLDAPDSLVEDLQSISNDCAERYEECGQDYQDGLDNMPEGLQEGDVGQEMQQKIDALEEAASNLRDLELPDVPSRDDEDSDVEGAQLSDEDYEQIISDWFDECLDAVRTAINELEL